VCARTCMRESAHACECACARSVRMHTGAVRSQLGPKHPLYELITRKKQQLFCVKTWNAESKEPIRSGPTSRKLCSVWLAQICTLLQAESPVKVKVPRWSRTLRRGITRSAHESDRKGSHLALKALCKVATKTRASGVSTSADLPRTSPSTRTPALMGVRSRLGAKRKCNFILVYKNGTGRRFVSQRNNSTRPTDRIEMFLDRASTLYIIVNVSFPRLQSLSRTTMQPDVPMCRDLKVTAPFLCYTHHH